VSSGMCVPSKRREGFRASKKCQMVASPPEPPLPSKSIAVEICAVMVVCFSDCDLPLRDFIFRAV
jgi:hypothetical protein